MNSEQDAFDFIGDIAIIGMTCRFPKARNLEAFWQNLRAGVEALTPLSEEAILSAGIDPSVIARPNYVRQAPILEDIELFDHAFFGLTPREAELLDPQHRLFLESAWSVLENAGYDPERYQGRIGVYAGADANRYYIYNIMSNLAMLAALSPEQLMTLSDKDYLSTRVSYQLNLRGPSIAVQSACSTSLVAVHLASQSLLNGECDMALAGGISIRIPQEEGYLYVEGGILSPDGHCRAFDANARGTIFGSGLGIVVLKRLQDALKDGDHVYAVIKGSAVNNDGALKVGFSAPGVDGQVKVVTEALAIADINPETITYIETHGTGTELGDPIEITALTRAFETYTDKKQFCAIGSVKTNLGHTSTAAGAAGLIKTVLALKNREIPPSLNYKEPNPQIHFDESPFQVNSTLAEWPENGQPRRAGVSSFGMGGTNAHLILEEAPQMAPPDKGHADQLLLVSAKSVEALEHITTNLGHQLDQQADVCLADVAYTLQVGRRAFPHRRALVCGDVAEAVAGLKGEMPDQLLTGYTDQKYRSLFFMFPGQGAQYANMGRGLYESEPLFREAVDRCVEILRPHLGFDLLPLLYPEPEFAAEAAQRLQQTAVTQPALFVIEYALATLWQAWGIQANGMIGHSVGEYVAACLAGVFQLEDALWLITQRGKLIQQLPAGSMLSVSLTEVEVWPYLNDQISLAAINAPQLCTVSGPTGAIDELQIKLEAQGINVRRLHTSHAFHSPMMEPILGRFLACVARIPLNKPNIPFVSNLTGTWIRDEEATDPAYWAKHIRQPVRFAEGVQILLAEQDPILLEVGPGYTLSTFAKRQPTQMVYSSLRHPNQDQADRPFLLKSLGRLWLAGVEVDWQGFYKGERRHRVPLPTYPFEPTRCWIEPNKSTFSKKPDALSRNPKMENWFYVPSWKRTAPLQAFQLTKIDEQKRWLLFLDVCGVGRSLTEQLLKAGQQVVTVSLGEQFVKLSENAYTIDPKSKVDYETLLSTLADESLSPQHVVHLWSVTAVEDEYFGRQQFDHMQQLGFYSVLFLVQTIRKLNMLDCLRLEIVTNDLQPITGAETLCPAKAPVLGLNKVVSQEYPGMICRSIDLANLSPIAGYTTPVSEQIMAELLAEPSQLVVAYRGGHRWIQDFEALPLSEQVGTQAKLREDGVYLVADGLNNVGLAFARHLVQQKDIKLILLGPADFPDLSDWPQWLATHGDQDEISQKVRQLQTIAHSSDNFLFLPVAFYDEAQMQAVIAQIYEMYGKLNGVIYTGSSIDNEFTTVADLAYEAFAPTFQNKAHGLYVLQEVVKDKPLDFCVVMSSISSILGGLGLCSYVALNNFADYFVHSQNKSSTFGWTSIDWDVWRFGEDQNLGRWMGASVADLSITPEEAAQAWLRILSLQQVPQLVVSTGSLSARIEQWSKLPVLAKGDKSQSTQKHARPALETAYIAPDTETEKKITQIWQEMFGIESIGIHDDFFALGGHSVLGIQIISRLRETYEVEIPVSTLFATPTVAAVSHAVDEILQNGTHAARKTIVMAEFERGRL